MAGACSLFRKTGPQVASPPTQKEPAPEEPSSCCFGCDDLGLFVDICISICSAPPAERLKACGDCGSVCTADTASTASTASTQCVSNTPSLNGIAREHSRETATDTSLCSGCSDSSEVHSGETKDTPPALLELQPPKLLRKDVCRVGTKSGAGPRSLTPPSPLKINIVYRDPPSNSESSIVELMTIGAAEPTLISRQQEGLTRSEQSTEERWKEYRNRSIQGVLRSFN